MEKQVHLSVVATSRNDDHGGSLSYRMQHFVTGFVEQCKRHDLNAELILVEWNPPDDRPPLAEVLEFTSDTGPCDIRIIRVPKEVHMQYKHAENLPLFQMIAKNVGIKRAKGKFVLATNIDILFSDEVICYMRDHLKQGFLYRADRLDVPNELPHTNSLDDLLAFCKRNHLRINGKFGSVNTAEKLQHALVDPDKDKLIHNLKWIKHQFVSLFSRPSGDFRRDIPVTLHTNGCGDFTLLSNIEWENLRGYAEWPMYSFHIDSLLLYQALNNGITQVDLPREMAVYHIEHGPGSGHSPEGGTLLFKRLEEKGISYLRDSDLLDLVERMYASRKYSVFNDEKWGLSHLSLEEIAV